jgi:septum formation protein
MRIILGSSSPRRREILGKLLDAFEVLSPDISETARDGESPSTFAERISAEKADCLLSALGAPGGPLLLITCDTIVAIGGSILGKPGDFEDAVSKIRALNGKTHEVISGLTLVHIDGGVTRKTGCERTAVTFKSLGEEEIVRYLNGIAYHDKAGAYAAQEKGEMIIDRISGSRTNVIGFPLRLFFAMLSEMGIAMRVFPGGGPARPGNNN